MKYAEYRDLEKGCQEALRQIEERDYAARLHQDGMLVVLKYGIAGYKKRCRVMQGYSAVNNIIMMIDMYSKYTDNKSRMIICSIASEFISEIPKQQSRNIQDALESKYENYNNSLYLAIKTVYKEFIMSKHTYINPNLVHNFKQPITYDELYEEGKNNVTNIVDDDEESLTYICNALWDDLQTQWANYKAYIEHGITARMLMELRKSAVLPMAKELYDFYSLHSSCETYKDVHKFRSNW